MQPSAASEIEVGTADSEKAGTLYRGEVSVENNTVEGVETTTELIQAPPEKLSPLQRLCFHFSLSPTTSQADKQILSILNAISANFHAPDLEGALATLAFLGAYRLDVRNPPWFLVSGASASGKTTILMDWLLEGVGEDHKHISQLSPNTLMSGLTKGKGQGANNSLVIKYGPRALVMFKDLTTLLSQHDSVIKKVAGTMREIYDGKTSTPFGTGKEVQWEGNWSVIAALTPEAEREWGRFRMHGERFLVLRWRAPVTKMGDISQVALAAMQDRTTKAEYEEKRDRCRDLVRELVDSPNLGPLKQSQALSTEELIGYGMPQLSSLVALLRTNPTKEDQKTPSYVDGPEEPGRVGRQLMNVGDGLAALRRQPKIGLGEIRLIRRVGWDSVPTQRRWIIDALMKARGTRKFERVREVELMAPYTRFTSIETLRNHLRELLALEIVEVKDRMWGLREGFVGLLREGLYGRTRN